MAKVGSSANSCSRCPLCSFQGCFFGEAISNVDKQVMPTEIKVIKVMSSFGMGAHNVFHFWIFQSNHFRTEKNERRQQ